MVQTGSHPQSLAEFGKIYQSEGFLETERRVRKENVINMSTIFFVLYFYVFGFQICFRNPIRRVPKKGEMSDSSSGLKSWAS